MNCQKCGAQINDGAKFCEECGSPIDKQTVPVQQQSDTYNSNSQIPSKSQKQRSKLNAWQIVLIVLGGVFLLFIMFICSIIGFSFVFGTTDTSADTQTSIVDTTEVENNFATKSSTDNIDVIKNNIKVKTEVSKDGVIAAFITNNNDITIDEIDLDVKFYDSNNKVIDLGEDGHDVVLPNSTVVSRIDPPKRYDHLETEISVELDEYSSYENHSKDVELSYNIGDDCVIVQLTNNSNVKIDELEYIVLLYNGDDLVSVEYPDDVYDLDSGDTDTEKVLTLVTYDKAKVYLNQAHTFGIDY